MKFKQILIVTIVIYLLHMLSYVCVFVMKDTHDTFALTTGKGDVGLSFDYQIFASQIQDSYRCNNIWFQQDPNIYENHGIDKIPSGNLVYWLVSLSHYIIDYPSFPFILMPFFAIFIAVFFVAKILKILLPPGSKLLFTATLFSVMVVCLASFDLLRSPLYYICDTFMGDTRFLRYTSRFPHMEFSFFMPILWLFTLLNFIRNHKWQNALFLGGALLLLQYSYFYFFTAAIVMSFIMILFHIKAFKKDILLLLLVAGVYFMGSAPFWLKFFSFNNSPIGIEYAVRVGREYLGISIPIVVIGYFFVLFIIDAFCVASKERGLIKQNKKMFFLALIKESNLNIALLITAMICYNVQLVMGYTVQQYHWLHTFYFVVFATISGVYFVKFYESAKLLFPTKKIGQLIKFAGVMIMIFLVVQVFPRAYYFGKYWSRSFVFNLDEQQFINEINKNNKKVYFSPTFSLMHTIAANSENYIYVPNGFNTMLLNDSILQRAIEGFKVAGYSVEQILTEFKLSYRGDEHTAAVYKEGEYGFYENNNLLHYLFHNTYVKSSKMSPLFPNELETKIINIYKNLPPRPLNRLDYIVLYKKAQNQPQNPPSFMSVVFDNPLFIVYKLED